MSESPLPSSSRVVVVGAGIGGLTASALLAQQGYDVLVVEQAYVPGGCASTFKRQGFTFDVGATQVAGLESGGIHQRIFQQLGVEMPAATPCNPACAVFLPHESEPINVWRNPQQWREERLRQFPGSERFWGLMERLFEISWRFQGRDPILPPRSLWDMGQLLKAVRPDTLLTLPFAFLTVGDLLRLLGLADDLRLRTFLDMQLKLYSQVRGEETALLYAATALGVSQSPQGIYHLEGSMQVLSNKLVKALRKYKGKLRLRHTVEQVHGEGKRVTGVTIREQKTGKVWTEAADHIVANVTVQNLRKLVDFPTTPTPLPSRFLPPTSFLGSEGYQYRIDKLPAPQGAFVLYLGVTRDAIPTDCPLHLQFLYHYEGEIGEKNSLFVSVSQPGDGRAPEGKATITASAFVDPRPWWQGTREEYEQRKGDYEQTALSHLQSYFNLTPDTIVHQESATPRTFARFTAREMGYVGGVGQRVLTFGPFGFGTRTPLENLWLVGDSTHPGEGTAGVSYSALTAVRQLERS
ncbi:C-3',4' desaturase CrtD [Spirulina sp. CS-785/01]|uniref:C-3',4' desaturase CrtD n=1 Tax=Spirulina sp. CS-785/01 TaxID=3021716 RepID=UPI00232BB266|nr:C-3',4' desaturase CrtD [Spirulina sp. CS-785/01]MDB9314401.1 C-3',4' desaturase CrtD [Spirulina sp. CS-785/01]